jgi:hypothetical protein
MTFGSGNSILSLAALSKEGRSPTSPTELRNMPGRARTKLTAVLISSSASNGSYHVALRLDIPAAHGPRARLLMPYNWVTSHHVTYGKDFEETLKLCNEREIAVQTIKSLARGPWAAGISKRRATWYEPLEADEDIKTAVNFVLAR